MGVQQNMINPMLGKRQMLGDTKDCCCTRRAEASKVAMMAYGVEDWDLAVLRRKFKWAGHVSRFAKHDPKRLTLLMLRYRERSWLKQVVHGEGNLKKAQYHH